ncbi:ParB/RepB/Spo0J family partition protein [Clostridium polynesiense]|uniref:ParB/RepB/Spo0J family partition protein n=1 Tax=Clostridium polynesiense TaxID=1325933 RepID=UPI00058C2DD4|nr:ParB/RepB/Spo0J family partition protein [Clostridium polynesiense]
MEILQKVINIYKTDDYQKFFTSSIYNRQVSKKSKYNKMYKSIKNIGQIEPILVKNYENKYIIVDGQHRFECCKNLGIPVLFYIDNDVNMTELLNGHTISISFKSLDFVGIASSRQIPIFMLINRLFSSQDNKLQITSLIEIIFTFIINDEKTIFRNSIFYNQCIDNYEEAFKKYNRPIEDSKMKGIQEFICLMDELAEILEIKKNLKVNLCRQALIYHLDHKEYGVSFKTIINFLKAEKPTKFAYCTLLRNATKDTEFRSLFQEIAAKINKNSSK